MRDHTSTWSGLLVVKNGPCPPFALHPSFVRVSEGQGKLSTVCSISPVSSSPYTTLIRAVSLPNVNGRARLDAGYQEGARVQVGLWKNMTSGSNLSIGVEDSFGCCEYGRNI